MDLFTLAAKLTLDSSKFNSGIQEAEKKGSKLTTTLNKAKTVIKAVAGAAVIGKATSSMKEFAKQAASAGDKIDKQSQSLGLSRKAYQEWDYILSQNGSSIDSLGVSMKTLNKAILSGKDSVKNLGISYDELKGKNMEEQFELVVKALQEMPESAEKSALAVELFGKNGMELLPLLNSSADSVDELKKRFQELGIEMSDEQIDNAVHYTDAMDTLERTFNGIKYAIGNELLPTMTTWANKAANYAGKLLKAYKTDGLLGVFKTLDEDISSMTKRMRESGNPVLSALADIIDGIKEGVKIVIGLFTNFPETVRSLKESDSAALRILGTVIETIKDVLDWIINHQTEVTVAVGAIIAAFAISKIVSIVSSLNPITVILSAIAAAATLIVQNWEPIKEFFINLWEKVKEAAETAWNVIKDLWENATGKIREVWGTIATWFKENVWDKIVEFFEHPWETISQLWTNIKSTISDAWNTIANWFDESVWKPISNFFKPVWEFISNLWTDVKKNISNAWVTIANWFNNSVWKPISDFFKPVWEFVSNLWTDVKKNISNAWVSIANWFNNSVWKPISDFFKPVWDFITNLWSDVKKNISNAWASIANWFNNTVWKPISDFFKPVWEFISNLWSDVKKNIVNAWTSIANWFNNAVWKPISDFFRPVWDFIKNLWTDIKKNVSNAWASIANWFNNTVWKPISDFFKPVWDFISNLWVNVKKNIVNAWSGISSWFNNAVWKPIADFFRPVWNFIKQLWDGVVKKVALAWSTVSSVFSKYLKPIKDLFDRVVAAAQRLIDKVKKLLSLESLTNNTGVLQGGEASGQDWSEQANSSAAAIETPSWNAKGDWNVPYDDYLAKLHRGEMVLTASQARKYREGEGNSLDINALAKAVVGAIREGMHGATVESYLDGRSITGDVNHRMLNDLKARRFVNA